MGGSSSKSKSDIGLTVNAVRSVNSLRTLRKMERGILDEKNKMENQREAAQEQLILLANKERRLDNVRQSINNQKNGIRNRKRNVLRNAVNMADNN